MVLYFVLLFFFFFNDTATTEIYTLSLHDALPISCGGSYLCTGNGGYDGPTGDRKSTRLNSSHVEISYAVFCLKKKKKLDDQSSADTNETSELNQARRIAWS